MPVLARCLVVEALLRLVELALLLVVVVVVEAVL